MKKSILLLLLLLPFTALIAQKSPAKFGKTLDSDFKYKLCPIDSSADAYYIFDFANVHFVYDSHLGWTWQMERHSKIKIVNDNGKDYANIIIPYYEGRKSKEDIYKLEGYTYNQVNGKVEKTKLSKDQIFDEDVTDFIKREKISMPSVKAGSVIEISYTIVSDFLAYLRDWEFQKDIPVLHSELYIGFPEYYKYNINMKGYESLAVNENTNETGSATIQYRSDNSSGGSSISSQIVSYKVYKKHMVALNLPAFKDEPYVTTMENYRSAIEFELASIQYTGAKYQEFTSSWDAVVSYFLKHDYFGFKLDHAGFARSDIKDLVEKYPDADERLGAIYDMVKSRITWDGSYGMYSQRGLRDVYNDRNGSAMDINFILINLLRAADIQAYPVVLSTRKNGMIFPTFPTVDKFNYVIAMAVVKGKQILLDATDPYCPAGILPTRCLNGRGRVIDKNINTWVDLKSEIPTSNITFYNLSLHEDGNFKGNISNMMIGYSSMQFKAKRDEAQSLDKMIEDLQADYPGLAVDSFDIKGLDKKVGDVTANYNVNINDRSDVIGDLISFNPLFFDKLDENPFKLEERKFPVDFTYPFGEKIIIHIIIPEGYTVEALPEKLGVSTPEKDALFTYSAARNGNSINLNVSFQINKTIFLPDEYKIIREFFARMVAKESELITLKKSPDQAQLTSQ